MVSREVLLILLLFVSVISTFSFFRFSPSKSKETASPRQTKTNKGYLKLCPPGGPSFLDTMNLVCPMRRRKRSANAEDENVLVNVMNTCCDTGCNFNDILAICRDPFG